MRPPTLRIHSDDLIVDNFAGGGGASLGIEWALGRSPDIAVNHDREAVAMHQANHPHTRHFCEDVWKVDPKVACGGRKIALAWFSPDCKHFSKAKGGKPVEKKIRGLAWVVTRWAKAVRPRVIILENVEEFQDWGPLLDDGRPDAMRRGLTFRRWLGVLRNAGYEVEVRELRSCDYGAPTSRKRLFIIARSDGLPIVWPAPTHGAGRQPYRTAAECITWTIPCPSIFERSRPLAENTLRRIARGLKRYVFEAAKPFVVPVTHAGDERSHSIDEPFRTITAAHRGEHALVAPHMIRTDMHLSNAGCAYRMEEPLRTITTAGGHALVAPMLLPQTHGAGAAGPDKRSHSVEEPMRTITTLGAQFNLIAPTLVQTGYGERVGQAARCLDLHKPLGTVVGCGQKHALVSAFLAKHYGGHETPGSTPQLPFDTVTARDHHSLVTSHLMKLSQNSIGQDAREPLHTVMAGAVRFAEVRAFLIKYYGTDGDPQLGLPMHTVTTKDRFGLVTVHGEDYAIADIGMRMLVPRELFRAQGFPDSYKIEVVAGGKVLSKGAQVRMCGNSVTPPVAAALVAAQFAVGAAGERVA